MMVSSSVIISSTGNRKRGQERTGVGEQDTVVDNADNGLDAHDLAWGAGLHIRPGRRQLEGADCGGVGGMSL